MTGGWRVECEMGDGREGEETEEKGLREHDGGDDA